MPPQAPSPRKARNAQADTVTPRSAANSRPDLLWAHQLKRENTHLLDRMRALETQHRGYDAGIKSAEAAMDAVKGLMPTLKRLQDYVNAIQKDNEEVQRADREIVGQQLAKIQKELEQCRKTQQRFSALDTQHRADHAQLELTANDVDTMKTTLQKQQGMTNQADGKLSNELKALLQRMDAMELHRAEDARNLTNLEKTNSELRSEIARLNDEVEDSVPLSILTSGKRAKPESRLSVLPTTERPVPLSARAPTIHPSRAPVPSRSTPQVPSISQASTEEPPSSSPARPPRPIVPASAQSKKGSNTRRNKLVESPNRARVVPAGLPTQSTDDRRRQVTFREPVPSNKAQGSKTSTDPLRQSLQHVQVPQTQTQTQTYLNDPEELIRRSNAQRRKGNVAPLLTRRVSLAANSREFRDRSKNTQLGFTQTSNSRNTPASRAPRNTARPPKTTAQPPKNTSRVNKTAAKNEPPRESQSQERSHALVAPRDGRPASSPKPAAESALGKRPIADPSRPGPSSASPLKKKRREIIQVEDYEEFKKSGL